MKPREYRSYSQELKDNGYQFITNCPYKGRNVWRKHLSKDNLEESYIEFDVYEHSDDFGDATYTLRPFGVIERKECDCKVKTIINYNTLNIVDIESMFEYYSDKINEK